MLVVHKFNQVICHKYRLEEVEISWSLKRQKYNLLENSNSFKNSNFINNWRKITKMEMIE